MEIEQCSNESPLGQERRKQERNKERKKQRKTKKDFLDFNEVNA